MFAVLIDCGYQREDLWCLRNLRKSVKKGKIDDGDGGDVCGKLGPTINNAKTWQRCQSLNRVDARLICPGEPT